MGIVQEKFQVIEPLPPKEDNLWATPESARRSHAVSKSNELPPGEDGLTQDGIRNVWGESISGCYAKGKDAGDVTDDCNPKSIKSGYDRKKMLPTDDMYTNEHNDAFYNEAKSDGEVGFMERNNYLDRL